MSRRDFSKSELVFFDKDIVKKMQHFFKKIYFIVRKITFKKYSFACHCYQYLIEFEHCLSAQKCFLIFASKTNHELGPGFAQIWLISDIQNPTFKKQKQ